MLKYIECIDAGTDYCPCKLSERDECIICSQLKGKEFCDCLYWNGTCIYQEYLWNGQKSKKTREFKNFDIIEKQYLREDILLFKIKVPQSLARELDNIGAYVFVKKPEDDVSFSTPLSILDCDIMEGIITVCFKIRGIKTKALKECTDLISVKGPYLNGIEGQKFLKNAKGNMLVLVRGIAGVPALMAIKKLSDKVYNFHVLIDYRDVKKSYLEKYFNNLNCKLKYLKFYNNDKLDNKADETIKDYINKYNIKTILIAGSDNFHSLVINSIYPLHKDINFATTNNASMCCGEGICGCCSMKIKSGKEIRACKQQYNPVEVFYKEMDRK